MPNDGPPPRHLHPVEHEPPDDGYEPPPNPSYLAEQAVLGALILAPHLGPAVRPHLQPTDFAIPRHELIWDAIHDLTDTNPTPPDLITLATHFAKTGELNRQGGPAYLHNLTQAVPGGTPIAPQVEAWATIVRDTARIRVVESVGTGLRDLAARATVDKVDAYLGQALQKLDDVVMRFGPSTTNPAATGLADLTWILTGTPPTAEPPVYGRRTDGTALFYAGRHNGVFGDPESGKTWLAQVAGVEAMNNGGTFAMIDVDHNGQNHTAARLMLLGARWEHIADPDTFRYYEPEDADQLRAAVNDITTRAPSVVVLDSIGEILPMLGVKSVDNDEITAALREVVMPPAKAGSCVISVDHLPKSIEARGTGYAIGGTAKKRAIDGAYLRAEARLNPTPGGIGKITLRIEKDRTGELRKSSGGGYAGTFTLDSTQDHVTTWTIGRDEVPKNDDGTFRPTSLMERIATFIADHDGCTGREIETGVTGKSTWKRDAIKILVYEGHVARTPGSHRSWTHTLLIPYREAEDDHANPTI